MAPAGCVAELTIYRFSGGTFRDADGRALAGLPGVLEALFAYWQGRRRGRRFPARPDIDPVDIPALLEHLLLVDVLRDPLDFRYRLVGGHIVEQGGRSLQGQTVRDLLDSGDARARALQPEALLAGQAVAETLAPVCIEMSYRPSTANNSKLLLGVLLPLGPQGDELTMLLGGFSFGA